MIFNKPNKSIQFKEINKDNPRCLGPPHFTFRQAITERERINNTIKEHQYLQVEPIGEASSKHVFRPRVKSKEIQPDMKFPSRRSYQIISDKSINQKPESDSDKKSEAILNLGFKFKSAFSLMFNKGQTNKPKAKNNNLELNSSHNIEHKNILALVAESALMKCKYITPKKASTSAKKINYKHYK